MAFPLEGTWQTAVVLVREHRRGMRGRQPRGSGPGAAYGPARDSLGSCPIAVRHAPRQARSPTAGPPHIPEELLGLRRDRPARPPSPSPVRCPVVSRSWPCGRLPHPRRRDPVRTMAFLDDARAT